MKFSITKIAAGVAMVVAASSAQAALNSLNFLTIEGDAVTTYGVDPSGSPTASSSWYLSSNGTAADSFFTMGGSKVPTTIDTQFAYLYGGQINLNSVAQESVTNWTYYSAPGDNDLVTGASVLSASGDTATVDLSGWRVDWTTALDVNMGGLAWSTGFVSGQGKVTCDVGSGCAEGSAYTLKYTATVPADSPSFPGVKYYMELHGTVGAVPEASTYGMMLAGLGLVGFAVRRRKSVI